MEVVKGLLLVLHFIGLASIIGGVLVQLRAETRRIDAFVLHGAWTQLLTGVALVGVVEAIGDDEVDNVKIGVKLLVLVAILAIALVHRRRPSVPTWAWAGIGGLTVLNIAIAVLWKPGVLG